MRFNHIIYVALLLIVVSPAEAWLTWLSFAKPQPAENVTVIEAQEPTPPPQEDVGLNPSLQPSGQPSTSTQPSRSPTLMPTKEPPATISPTTSPTSSPTTRSPTEQSFDQGSGSEPSNEEEEEAENHIFQCPFPLDVGCTAVDHSISKDECSTVGNLCNNHQGTNNNHGQHAEYCCLDACSRKYCTAKGTFVGLDDDIVASLSGGAKNKPQALHDKGTTFTGQPIVIDVLFNDFLHDPLQEEHHPHGAGDSSEDGIDLDFGTTSLELKDIVTNGRHGTCTILNNSILYSPNDGYSGPDKCGYRVCDKDSTKRSCNVASISITINKQVEELELNVDLRPDLEDFIVPLPLSEVPIPMDQGTTTLTLIDPEDLMTDEVWNEVDESTTDMDDSFGDDDDGSNNIVVVETLDPYPQVDEAWDEYMGNCDQDEVLISFELQTDYYGDDVTWELVRQYDDGNSTVEISKGPYNYGEYTFDQVDLCVPSPSMYTFTIRDNWGDGLCNSKGCGYYKLFLDGREIVYVTHYAKNNTHTLNLGYDSMSNMTQREIQYLNAHNRRRNKYHTMYNASYVPLIWSPKLAEESSRWANELLNACDSDGIEHEPGVSEGENLAKNKGLVDENGLGWGQFFSPESEYTSASLCSTLCPTSFYGSMACVLVRISHLTFSATCYRQKSHEGGSNVK